MNLIEETGALLRQAGFKISVPPATSGTVLYFEDANVLGFAKQFSSATELLGSWESEQDGFLRRHSSALRAEPAKAWNVYSVLLCSVACPSELRTAFEAIEEDFRGSRKIARAGLMSPSDVERALLPLLPIRATVVLQTQDPLLLVRERLRDTPANVIDGLLGTAAPRVLAAWLTEQT